MPLRGEMMSVSISKMMKLSAQFVPGKVIILH